MISLLAQVVKRKEREVTIKMKILTKKIQQLETL